MNRPDLDPSTGVYYGYKEIREKFNLPKKGPFKFGIPTLKKYDLLDKLLESIKSQTIWPMEVVICDNGGKFDREKYKNYPIPISVIYPSYNTGCGGGWNTIIQYTGDSDLILASDDTELLFNDSLEKMYVYTFPETRHSEIVFGYAWSCYYITRKMINEIIGKFDSMIWPAFFEDTDYSTRMGIYLRTVKQFNASDIHVCRNYSATVLYHWAGSTPFWNRNKNYVYKKWDYARQDVPCEERNLIPFNGKHYDTLDIEISIIEDKFVELDVSKYKNTNILCEVYDNNTILNLCKASPKSLIIFGNGEPVDKLERFYIILQKYPIFFKIVRTTEQLNEIMKFIPFDHVIKSPL